MNPEIFFVPEVEIKGLLVMGAFMIVGLVLATYFSLRPDADKHKLAVNFSYVLGFFGVTVGNIVRSSLYIKSYGAYTMTCYTLSPVILLFIAYIGLLMVCTQYIPYRKRNQDSESAPAVIQGMAWMFLLCSALAVFCIFLLLQNL